MAPRLPGKGTIARRLSGYYGLPHMDTGRLYRAVGVAALKAGVPLDAAGPLADIARTLDLNDFIEHELRSAEAGKAASVVAAIPSVRQALFELQRAFATRAGGALLDGRDIGTVIAPDADVKLWVDADVNQRAARRWKELVRRRRSDHAGNGDPAAENPRCARPGTGRCPRRNGRRCHLDRYD